MIAEDINIVKCCDYEIFHILPESISPVSDVSRITGEIPSTFDIDGRGI